MALEIEKKFFVLDDSFKKFSHQSIRITQGYILSSKDKVLRVRITPEISKIAIKSGNDIIRQEYEYKVPTKDAKQLLSLCDGYKIEKKRYLKENKGLIVAEIELDNENQEFAKPDWVGNEISLDKRYYNHYLSKIPYSLW